MLKKESDTLRKIELIDQLCNGLENLYLCEKLEEFSGSYYPSMNNFLSESKTLEKLKLTIKSHPMPNWLKINLPKLKYLVIRIYYWSYYLDENSIPNWPKSNFPELKCLVIRMDNFLQGSILAETQYPALERLKIQSENIKTFIDDYSYQFLKNCPNLKSIQFEDFSDENLDETEFANLYNIFENGKVFVFLGDDDPNQKLFLNYILEFNPKLLVKYEQELQKFTDWCRQNPEYEMYEI